jgi:hypothetical protein
MWKSTAKFLVHLLLCFVVVVVVVFVVAAAAVVVIVVMNGFSEAGFKLRKETISFQTKI